jgi:carbon monoxide dehydrogenase subunit G
MNVETEFTVSAPGDRVFEELAQLDAVASAVPGSSMRRVDGDAGFEGPLRVVVAGSERDCIGTLRQIDVDRDGRSTSCWFRVRDAAGPGFATGLIRGHVTDANGSAHVALSLEGRLAAPGLDETKVGDEAQKLLASLADSLGTSLAERASRPPAPVSAKPAAAAAPSRPAAPAARAPLPAAPSPARSGPPAPLIGAGIIVLLLAVLFRRRGRR